MMKKRKKAIQKHTKRSFALGALCLTFHQVVTGNGNMRQAYEESLPRMRVPESKHRGWLETECPGRDTCPTSHFARDTLVCRHPKCKPASFLSYMMKKTEQSLSEDKEVNKPYAESGALPANWARKRHEFLMREFNTIETIQKAEQAAGKLRDAFASLSEGTSSLAGLLGILDDANQVLVAFKVRAEQLTDAFEWVSVNVADPGTAHIGAVIAIMHALRVRRSPQNLVQPNA